MRSALRYAFGAAFVAGAVGLLATTSCGSVPDSGRFTLVLQPDYEVYKTSVDNYLRRRCGTLDCHGQPGRAYRMYGREGFRLYNEDAGLVSGLQPTTEAETRANFQAIVGLEPEEMSRLIATQGSDPNKLLFLRKPLRLERHKGGPAMAEDDPGYRCVVAWLRIPVFRFVDGPDGPDGPKVPEPIPPAERIPLTPRQLQDCATAESYP
jgi:hypothetical protein